MAITRVVNPVVVAAASANSASGNHTCANGQTDLFVWVLCRNGTVASPASVTFGGVGLTLVTANTSTGRGCQLYWLPKASHPGNGTHSLAIGTWTTADRVAGAVAEYTTSTELEFVDENFIAGVVSTDVNLAITALTAELVLSQCYRGSSATYTPDSGQTEFIDSQWVSGCNSVAGEGVGPSTQMDWTVVGGAGNSSAISAVFREAAGGDIEIPTGTAFEENSVGVFALSKHVTTGSAGEADSVFALNLSKVLAVGTSQEADAAFALALSKQLAAGTAVEVDSVATLALLKIIASSEAAEVDRVFSLFGAVTTIPAGMAREQNSVPGLSLQKLIGLDAARETDLAIGLALSKHVTAGTAFEVDRVFSLLPIVATDIQAAIAALAMTPRPVATLFLYPKPRARLTRQ